MPILTREGGGGMTRRNARKREGQSRTPSHRLRPSMLSRDPSGLARAKKNVIFQKTQKSSQWCQYSLSSGPAQRSHGSLNLGTGTLLSTLFEVVKALAHNKKGTKKETLISGTVGRANREKGDGFDSHSFFSLRDKRGGPFKSTRFDPIGVCERVLIPFSRIVFSYLD